MGDTREIHNSGSGSLVLIGGGGHSLVVAEAALLCGWSLGGFFDDHAEAVLRRGSPSAPRLGTLDDTRSLPALLRQHPSNAWILVIGDTGVRRRMLNLVGPSAPRAATIVHPSAVVSPSATIGAGVFVGPRAVVHTRARIGNHAIINTGCIVEHECDIGENVHCAPGGVLGGRTRVGPDSLVGIGARTLPGAVIGAGAVVGAGAMVLKQVSDGTTVVGVPAKPRHPK
ncbi:MAG: NeuD/PglB/VioB family sugar acetyltransferase [Phycisphaerales bacterium]